MAKEKWIIAANSTIARLFKLEGMELIEMPALVHPEGRLHGKDLVSDQQGEVYGSGPYNVSRYAAEPKTPPKKNEDQQFAKEVADHLELARAKGIIEKLYLAASPAFLGLVRQEFQKPLSDIIETSVSKDITHLDKKQIRTYFPIGL